MFKRVEKRITKKRKEEELGITEEIKEAIGLNDVDSDDSDSGESEASGSSSPPQVLLSKRKRSLEDEVDGGSGAASDSGTSDEEEEEHDVQMTVEEALHNPLYIISIQPDVRGCIVCPRKILKNDTMTSVHTSSQAHQRRISKFKEAAASAKPDDDAREVLSVAFVPTPESQPKSVSSDSAPRSNRAAKRIAKFEKMKAKRQKHKAAKARSIAARAAKKQQTTAGSESETSDAALTPDPPKKNPSWSILLLGSR
ncbi:hypothetical protein BJ322DRAFT_1021975 [Thelephora terrestris]|uniref:Uncharacterized protein n=1 Tax=Thelephora terrestris TaxID=56493 RepID=A0A9P6HAY5_9AGAM|nr:hypothetical protein BJ322DRAFT_1021975 [Thelephora terrestris]